MPPDVMLPSWRSDREGEQVKTRECRDCKVPLTFESRAQRCPGCYERWNAARFCLPKDDGGTELPQFMEDTALPAIKVVDLGD